MKLVPSKIRFLLLPTLLGSVVFFAAVMNGICVEKMVNKMAPPGNSYMKVSSIAAMPDFIPGLGTLYVEPSMLPSGPFHAYDRKGNLVSTIYMIPLNKISEQNDLKNLRMGAETVDHIDICFDAGHPPMREPHYRVIFWYVSPEKKAELK
ncbi:MAG TPA: hypothetical protein VLZ07_05055 [Syntrophales bacterium]|nr:hypothetical protein [Syntrophales bacterium]